ncbi:P-loop containing nucleoside triphosphate hydrolase protein [Corynespora cassiicola Philippines]|uniref:P-loop containing nucleoside triphosphate hydrolase protein n=1 Tax=Corynespora cassiicola Philippines TaxID=1448308 RepID=A0A2T2NM57_CORCC|nr:P-loop containing nucleoside triphosphate hydrolase protein [Corynespora cassiicola Philippines]
MTDDQALRCPEVVGGFALQEKVWAEFRVDRLKQIEWNSEAYDRLEMDKELKGVIEALVAGHRQHSATNHHLPQFDDIIAGKGLGLSFLLQGPPGLGKTLTAESVAKQLKKPVYSVTSGELGTTVRDMEINLRKAFGIAKEWNAILLLDEADVFMSKRSVDNLEKNAFISVFLRLMEYYQGILFLTTNRAEDFDEAFISRIHLIIDYQPLDASRRKIIWQNLAKNVTDQEDKSLDDATFEYLSTRYDINGREIKNMLRTAWSLARSEEKPLRLEHIQRVADIWAAGRKASKD